MTTSAADHYERLLAEHYTWMLGGDVHALAAEQTRLLTDLGVSAPGRTGVAVDLGCGSGAQTIALAGLGFTPVFAVDTSRTLLDELVEHADANPSIRPVQADMRTAATEAAGPGGARVVVCMGDTVTHLPTMADVTTMLDDVVTALEPGGSFVLTYRDLTEPLRGTDRFLPVRATDDRILTCFLEYVDDETVTVHDIVHTRSGDAWTQQCGSYPKLRIGAQWLAGECRRAGLAVTADDAGPRGMRVLAATKPVGDAP